MSRGDIFARRAPADRGRVVAAAAVVTPILPSAIAGYCWDLNPEVGITYGAGGAGAGLVAAISDQSPSAAHALQGTPALQATRIVADASFNGHDSIDHTVLDSSLQIVTPLGIRHIFAVARYPGTTFAFFQNLVSRTPFANIWQGEAGVATWRTVDNIPSTNVRDGITTAVALSASNDPHVHESVLNALDTSSTWMVGASAGAGSGRQWQGRWARIVAFNVPVTGADLAGLRLYLKQRYGTP